MVEYIICHADKIKWWGSQYYVSMLNLSLTKIPHNIFFSRSFDTIQNLWLLYRPHAYHGHFSCVSTFILPHFSIPCLTTFRPLPPQHTYGDDELNRTNGKQEKKMITYALKYHILTYLKFHKVAAYQKIAFDLLFNVSIYAELEQFSCVSV